MASTNGAAAEVQALVGHLALPDIADCERPVDSPAFAAGLAIGSSLNIAAWAAWARRGGCGLSYGGWWTLNVGFVAIREQSGVFPGAKLSETADGDYRGNGHVLRLQSASCGLGRRGRACRRLVRDRQPGVGREGADRAYPRALRRREHRRRPAQREITGLARTPPFDHRRRSACLRVPLLRTSGVFGRGIDQLVLAGVWGAGGVAGLAGGPEEA